MIFQADFTHFNVLPVFPNVNDSYFIFAVA